MLGSVFFLSFSSISFWTSSLSFRFFHSPGFHFVSPSTQLSSFHHILLLFYAIFLSRISCISHFLAVLVATPLQFHFVLLSFHLLIYFQIYRLVFFFHILILSLLSYISLILCIWFAFFVSFLTFLISFLYSLPFIHSFIPQVSPVTHSSPSP